MIHTYRDEPSVVADVLLATISLVRRDYQQTPTALAQPRDTLQEIVGQCRNDAATPVETTRGATAVLLETEFRIATSDLPVTSPAVACHRLLQMYDEDIVRHHGVGAKAQRVFQALHGLRIRTAVENGAPLGDEHWTKALEAWEVCRTFIVHQVLPRLGVVWGALTLPLGTSGVNLLPDDVLRLEELVHPERVHVAGTLDELLVALQASPGSVDVSVLDDARANFDWWFDVFLRTPSGHDAARLFAALDACHCSHRQPLEDLMEHPRVADGSVSLSVESAIDEVEVFCGSALFEEVLAELVTNADRHAAQHGTVPSLLLQVSRHGESHVRLRAAYRGTSPKEGVIPGRGRGLSDARLIMSEFGADVRWGTTREIPGIWPEGTSFGVTIDLTDWGRV